LRGVYYSRSLSCTIQCEKNLFTQFRNNILDAQNDTTTSSDSMQRHFKFASSEN